MPKPLSPPRRSSATIDLTDIDGDDYDAPEVGRVHRHDPGTQVILCGLKAKPELNGEHCEVVAWLPNKGRYKVQRSRVSDDDILLKPVNLMLACAGSERTVHVIGGFTKSAHFTNLPELQEWACANKARHREEGISYIFEEGTSHMSRKVVLHTGHEVKKTMQVGSLRRTGHIVHDEVTFWRDIAAANADLPVKKRRRTSAANVTPKRRRSSATSTQTGRSSGGGASGGANRSSGGGGASGGANRSSGGGGASGGDSRTVTDAQRIESLIECWKIKGDLLCAGCHVGSKRPIVGLYGMFVACTEYKGRMKCTHKMSKSDLSAEELDAWCNPC